MRFQDSREQQAKEHFGGPNSVFRRDVPGKTFTPSADYYREQAEETPKRRPLGMPKVLKPGGLLNPGRKDTTWRDPKMEAYEFQKSMGVIDPDKLEKHGPPTPSKPPTQQNGAWGAYTPMSKPPDPVLAALNSAGFEVDVPRGKGMDVGKFTGSTPLADHTYRVNEDENVYLREAFADNPVIIPGETVGLVRPGSVEMDAQLPVIHMEPLEAASLSYEAYNEMSSDQKAAIDFNTLLIDAREKDFTDAVELADDKTRAEYDAKVERLFGKNGGSNRYAPNLVDFLDQLDVVQVGQDLDEYLSLDRAIDEFEIGTFKFTSQDVRVLDELANGTDRAANYAQVREGGNVAAIDTATMQAVASKIQASLAQTGFTQSFDALVNGLTPDEPLGLGYGNTETDAIFQDALVKLGTPDVTAFGLAPDDDVAAWVTGMLKESGADEETLAAFYQYVGNQVQMYGQYGDDQQKTEAELVRQRVGLGGSDGEG